MTQRPNPGPPLPPPPPTGLKRRLPSGALQHYGPAACPASSPATTRPHDPRFPHASHRAMQASVKRGRVGLSFGKFGGRRGGQSSGLFLHAPRRRGAYLSDGPSPRHDSNIRNIDSNSQNTMFPSRGPPPPPPRRGPFIPPPPPPRKGLIVPVSQVVGRSDTQPTLPRVSNIHSTAGHVAPPTWQPPPPPPARQSNHVGTSIIALPKHPLSHVVKDSPRTSSRVVSAITKDTGANMSRRQEVATQSSTSTLWSSMKKECKGSSELLSATSNPADVMSAASMGPSSSTHSSDQVDQAWTQHTGPNAVKYYYNSITRVSTYSKPKCLESADLKKKNFTAPLQSRTCKEFLDRETGKKYYSDGVTTTWIKPEWWEGDDCPAKRKDGPEESCDLVAKNTSNNNHGIEFDDKTKVVAVFNALLLSKGVLPTTKWNEVTRMCASDTRWKSCNVLAIGERKQALAEYQTKRANELRDLERQERARTKDSFLQLLSEKLPTFSDFSAFSSRFSDVRDALSADERFVAVEDESTREALFLEFCEEVRKCDERKRRSEKREAKDAFLLFLKEMAELGILTLASTWNSFVASVEKLSDMRVKVSAAMSDSDRQLYFDEFVSRLQAMEDDKRRRIRDSRRRAERCQREAYRAMLKRLASRGVILPSTRWRHVERIVAEEEVFNHVQAQDRNAPRKLLEEFVEAWSTSYNKDRLLLSRLLHFSQKKGIAVTEDTTYDDFAKSLLESSSHAPEFFSSVQDMLKRDDPVSGIRLLYNELVSRAKEGNGSSTESNCSPGSFAWHRPCESSSSEDEGEIIEDGEVREKVE